MYGCLGFVSLRLGSVSPDENGGVLELSLRFCEFYFFTGYRIYRAWNFGVRLKRNRVIFQSTMSHWLEGVREGILLAPLTSLNEYEYKLTLLLDFSVITDTFNFSTFQVLPLSSIQKVFSTTHERTHKPNPRVINIPPKYSCQYTTWALDPTNHPADIVAQNVTWKVRNDMKSMNCMQSTSAE